jgi:hypothetical protein
MKLQRVMLENKSTNPLTQMLSVFLPYMSLGGRQPGDQVVLRVFAALQERGW